MDRPGIPTDLFARCESALSRDLGEGVLVLARGQVRPIEISPPGALIWALLKEPGTALSISKVLASRFGVDADNVRSDVAEVLRGLAAIGAIKSIGPL